MLLSLLLSISRDWARIIFTPRLLSGVISLIHNGKGAFLVQHTLKTTGILDGKHQNGNVVLAR
jgi:hypothetical protein